MKKILLVVLPLLCSCAVSHVHKVGVGNVPVENTFLYMTFTISRDTLNKKTHIELKSKSEIVGFVKTTDESFTSGKFLQFMFLDNHKKMISTQVVDHPLFFRAETLNDRQQFVTRTIELESSEFVLRVNRTANIGKLIITENRENRSPEKIYETSL